MIGMPPTAFVNPTKHPGSRCLVRHWFGIKNLPANAENAGDTDLILNQIPWSLPPGGGNGNPLQYYCLKKNNLMERGSLLGYSSWGCKESDITEWLSMKHSEGLDEGRQEGEKGGRRIENEEMNPWEHIGGVSITFHDLLDLNSFSMLPSINSDCSLPVDLELKWFPHWRQ